MIEENLLEKKCPVCGGDLIGISKTKKEHRNGPEDPPYVENWMIINCKKCDYKDEELLNSEQY